MTLTPAPDQVTRLDDGAGGRARLTPRQDKVRRRLVGVVFLLVFALLVWLSVALYNKQFTSAAMVTLYTDAVGNEMHPGADVKVRGVQVGEVRQISADGTGAKLELAIQPAMVPHIPANVTALMVPTTLFGARQVYLVMPAQPVPARLTDGSVITQDRSADAVELEKVLNNLLPLLRASEPDKLSITLTALAQGLQGHGQELGQTLVAANAYLHDYNKHLPALDTDIKRLAVLARNLNQSAPDLVQALTDFTVTSQTFAAERASVSALYSTVTTASQDLESFLVANSSNIIQLNADSVATLQILARYSPEFPCALKDLANFVPAADKLLGKGTSQHGLHVQMIVVRPLGPNHIGRYVAGKDTPVYGDNLGPHCYPIPFPGITLNDGATHSALAAPASPGRPPAGTPAHGRPAAQPAHTTAARGQLAGSPTESALVRELTGMALGRPPLAIPRWGSLLTAPLFRGTTVSLRTQE
jgi:phospholipid/cholesterol/gamma-HCH transport system substrate-binding protein